MAQVTLPFGIIAIHGRLGDKIYRSRRQPDGSYRVFVHDAPPRTKHGPSSDHHRSIIEPLSEDSACEQ